jgi:hypothetical protein
MNRILKYILWIIGIAIVIILAYGWALYNVADYACEKKCETKGALIHKLMPSGNFALDDVCVCYFPDKIEAIKFNG